MKQRSREELINEIQRVQDAIKRSSSRYLKEDYSRYLRRLERALNSQEKRDG